MMNVPEDSLKKRYFSKLLANLASLLINFGIQAIVPRGLGPKSFGDFQFLNNFFLQLVSFFDMGTSLAFFTKLSQQPSNKNLVAFYSGFVCIVSAVIFALVGASVLLGFQTFLWPGQEMRFIFLAAGLAVLTWISQLGSMITDAFSLTISAEVARIVQKIIGLLILIFLFFFFQINLLNFFLYQYFIFLLIIFLLFLIISGTGKLRDFFCFPSPPAASKYLSEFYSYSAPLFVFRLVVLVCEIFDRWILQVFSGSQQQGFYGLSFQVGALCFLFTSAMTPLLHREFAIAFSQKNLQQIAFLFRRYIPLLYAISAYFACFIASQGNLVSKIFGGEQFIDASLAIAIMAFYPIHQTYGQLSGSVFLATGQTTLYRNIGLKSLLCGLPITYFLIAPAEKFGLNAGAVGLCLKMVLTQIIGVNVQLYYNSKFLGLRFWKYLVHQVVCVVFFCLLAIFSGYLGALPFHANQVSPVWIFFLAGVIYSTLTVIFSFIVPQVFGLHKTDLKIAGRMLRKTLSWKTR